MFENELQGPRLRNSMPVRARRRLSFLSRAPKREVLEVTERLAALFKLLCCACLILFEVWEWLGDDEDDEEEIEVFTLVLLESKDV